MSTSWGGSPTNEALLALAHPEPTLRVKDPLAGLIARVMASDESERFVSTVSRNRLTPVLADYLSVLGMEVPEHMAAELVEDRVIRLRVMAVLHQVQAALDGVRWVVCKGPSVASLMVHPQHRVYNDLDILVHPEDFRTAVDHLTEIGVEELNQNWDAYLQHMVGEVPMLANGITVDLHWNLIGLSVLRKRIDLDVVTMMERRRQRRIGDSNAWVLDPADQLLHLAVHCGLSGATRLDQLRDIAVLTQTETGLNWDHFVQFADRSGAGSMAAHVLDRAVRALNAHVPIEVISSLASPTLGPRRVADRLTGANSFGSFTVVTQRDSVPARLEAVLRRIRTTVLSRLGLGPSWDFTNEKSPLYYAKEAGGDASRSRYFDAVARYRLRQ